MTWPTAPSLSSPTHPTLPRPSKPRPVLAHSSLQIPVSVPPILADYNDGIDPTKNDECTAINDLAACPSACCYSSVWEVRGAEWCGGVLGGPWGEGGEWGEGPRGEGG